MGVEEIVRSSGFCFGVGGFMIDGDIVSVGGDLNAVVDLPNINGGSGGGGGR